MAKKDTENKTSVRIGISDTTQELHIETATESEKIIAAANEAIDHNKTFQIKDIKNRVTLIPAGKISYIEVGDITDQKVGFTAL